MPPRFTLPDFKRHRGPLFWIRPANWWTGRRRFLRTDHSNDWRHEFLRDGGAPPPPPGFPSDPTARSRPFSWLIDRPAGAGFSCVILGDTGEGDASQYALLPLIWALDPSFMIINGDVAYPAGDTDDYTAGFFEPYRDLGIPIWAVPGNHEYYSDGRGREFFEVFCSTVLADRWQEHGLTLKEQPGSYWELAEPGVPVVVLGVDSGQSGALDGSGGFVGLFKRRADAEQHKWLDWRLSQAQDRGVPVVILFHIPKLVNARRNSIKLHQLHAIMARHACVKLVITAHIHNLQCYDPATFERFLHDLTDQAPAARPHYVVSGAGGAYIGSTHFEGPYPAVERYPTPGDFTLLADAGQKIVAKLSLAKTIGGDVITALSGFLGGIAGGRAETTDADQMRMMSLLYLQYHPVAGVTVTPYYVNDLGQLYPDGTVVQVQQGVPPLSRAAVDGCAVRPIIRL